MKHEKVSVVLHPEVTEREAEQAVNETIADFDAFFRGLGNEPLVRSEIAIIKTFCAYKLGLAKNGTPERVPPDAG